MEACFLFLIFGILLLLAALILLVTRDPRHSFASVLLYKVMGLQKMSKKDAVATSRKVGRGVALTGIVIILLSTAGLLIGSR